jgi:hypothetical protein
MRNAVCMGSIPTLLGLRPRCCRYAMDAASRRPWKFIPLVVRTSSDQNCCGTLKLLRIHEAVPVPTRCGSDQSSATAHPVKPALQRNINFCAKRHQSRCVRFRLIDSDARSGSQQDCARQRLAAFGAVSLLGNHRHRSAGVLVDPYSRMQTTRRRMQYALGVH